MREDNQRAHYISALLKIVGMAVSVALIVWAAAFAVTRGLGLNAVDPTAGASATTSSTPLPTVAIEPSDDPSPTTSVTPTPSSTPTKQPAGITLVASPARVGPGQKINLTGTVSGNPSGQVEVQRKDGGRWSSFAGVRTVVSGGAFATYIMTTRSGTQKFRVVLVGGSLKSNPVTVRVG